MEERVVSYRKENLATDFKRGVLYFVDGEIDLIDVALAMISGGVKDIRSFIDDGLIFPPISGEIDLWHAQEGVRFDSLEVPPYRLIQKVSG